MKDLSVFSLQNIQRALRTRWWVAVAAGAALFAALAIVVLTLQPAYTARAVVLLAPITEELDDASYKGRGTAMTDPFFIRSEVAIIASDGLARTVIQQLGLAKYPEFADADAASGHPYLTRDELALDRALDVYRKRLSVFNDGRSKTVEIAFTAADPRLAARIANAHASAYLKEQSTRRANARDKSVQWLKQEVNARAQEARDADALVQQFRVRNGIVTSRDATMVEQRLSQLSSQLMDARRQLATQTAMLEEIGTLRAGGDPADAATLLGNEPLTDLLRSRVQAEAEASALATRLVDDHPALIRQRQALAGINEVLEKQLRRAESEARIAQGSWQRQVNELSRAVNAEIASKLRQDQASTALPALMTEAQVKRTVFETVVSRYQTQLAEQGFSDPTAAIVSSAAPPSRHSFPRTGLLLVVAFMGAALAGILVTLLVNVLHPPSPDLNALADAVGIKALVAIPRFHNDSHEPGVMKIRDPRLFIEAIRSLRTALFEQSQARGTRVCLFTSAMPGQGKTLVAMSVARALARGGANVLFVEMDLRCPTAAKLAHLPDPPRGVAAVLEDSVHFADVVQRDETTGLDMLLAEAGASVALDRLTVRSVAAMVTKLRMHYDALIIDSPPVGVADSLTLANVADQTVVVSRDTSTADLAGAVRLLHERGATLAGLVLTDVDPRSVVLAERKMAPYAVGMPARVAVLRSA